MNTARVVIDFQKNNPFEDSITPSSHDPHAVTLLNALITSPSSLQTLKFEADTNFRGRYHKHSLITWIQSIHTFATEAQSSTLIDFDPPELLHGGKQDGDRHHRVK